MIDTLWLPRWRRCATATGFAWKGALLYLLALARRQVRTPAYVSTNYDAERAAVGAALDRLDLEAYVSGLDKPDFVLLDGRIQRALISDARRAMLRHIHGTVAELTRPGQTVVEFGSGDGRNLLSLRHAFPDRRFVGFELSPVSVEVARAAAEKFGLEVTFHQANVCEPIAAAAGIEDVGLVYSLVALEQMPRIFVHALDNMAALDPGAIALWEPMPELAPWSPIGVGIRARSIAIDRLRGLPAAAAELARRAGFSIGAPVPLAASENPFNPVTELVLRRQQSAA